MPVLLRLPIAYDPIYERGSSISSVNAAWSHSSSTLGSLSLTIDQSGNISGYSSGGCVYNGKISMINSSFNAYRVNVTLTSCGILNGNYSGLAVLADNTSTNDALIVGVSNPTTSITATFSNIAGMGVTLDATVTPTYADSNTYSVDVVQQICDAGPPPVYEYFADHGATVTISARRLNPNATFQPGTLYIEKYTVEFRRSTDSIGAPPIQSDTRYEVITITPPTGTGTNYVDASVILVDLLRKFKYYDDIYSGLYTSNWLNNYTATYTFEGQNQYGTKFSFMAQTNFQIGSFDYCD